MTPAPEPGPGGPLPGTEPRWWAPGGLAGSLPTPGLLMSGPHHPPRFLTHWHCPRVASGAGRCSQGPRPASGHCLPPQPGACLPTRLLGGRWMKVSSWAVSRIRWGPRTSCSCWMPNLEVRERARQGRWCQYPREWLPGPASDPEPSCPLGFPSRLPIIPSWAERPPPSTVPHRAPWTRSGLDPRPDVPAGPHPRCFQLAWRPPGALRPSGKGWAWRVAPSGCG